MSRKEPNASNLPWHPDLWVAGKYSPVEDDLVPAPAFSISQIRDSLLDQLFDVDKFEQTQQTPFIYFTAVMIHNSAVVANEAIDNMIMDAYYDDE